MGSGVGGEIMQSYLHVDESIVQVNNKIRLNPDLQSKILTTYAAAQEDINWKTLTGPDTYAAVVGDDLFVDVSAGAVDVSLPEVHNIGDQIRMKLITAATNALTVTPDGSQEIDGQSSLDLSSDYEWAVLVSNGANWFQIS